MSIDFDFSELSALKADVSAVGPKIAPFARQAVEVTARRTKDDARDLTRGSKYLGGVPASIDYDMKAGRDHIEADVGFNKRGQGHLGNIIEYGSRYFPARGPLTQALHQNEADFVKGIAKAAEDALGL